MTPVRPPQTASSPERFIRDIRARRRVAEVQEGLGEKARLIEGADGIFDVKVDGKPVYSKQ